MEIEIHFSTCVQSLERLFGCDNWETVQDEYYDVNSNKLISVDFSHFYLSCLEST